MRMDVTPAKNLHYNTRILHHILYWAWQQVSISNEQNSNIVVMIVMEMSKQDMSFDIGLRYSIDSC
jgi:hypothetical protein